MLTHAAQVLPGYAWLFPSLSNDANIGVAVHRYNQTPRHAVHHTRQLIESDRFRQIAGIGATATDRVRCQRKDAISDPAHIERFQECMLPVPGCFLATVR